jgi:hypothetical protein
MHEIVPPQGPAGGSLALRTGTLRRVMLEVGRTSYRVQYQRVGGPENGKGVQMTQELIREGQTPNTLQGGELSTEVVLRHVAGELGREFTFKTPVPFITTEPMPSAEATGAPK